MQISFTNCLHFYIDTMHKLINDAESYISQGELVEAHQKTKDEAIAQVCTNILFKWLRFVLFTFNYLPNSIDFLEQFHAKPKFVDEQFVSNFQRKMEGDIEEKFLAFNETNEAKYHSFMVSGWSKNELNSKKNKIFWLTEWELKKKKKNYWNSRTKPSCTIT